MTFRFFAKRAGVVTAATAALVLAGTSSASAHFCYKTWETEQSAAGKGGSSAWMSFEAIASMFVVDASGDPLCLAGIQELATAAGVELDTMINIRGTMAGGKFEQDGTGNKAISHLDFMALEAATAGAFETCGQTPPPPPA